MAEKRTAQNGVIEYRGREYRLEFNLNVMERIQDKYGTLQKWQDLLGDGKKRKEPDVKALLYGFGEMLNEAIDIDNEDREEKWEPLSEKQVGRVMSVLGFGDAMAQIQQAIVESTKDDSKNE